MPGMKLDLTKMEGQGVGDFTFDTTTSSVAGEDEFQIRHDHGHERQRTDPVDGNRRRDGRDARVQVKVVLGGE